MFPLIARLTAKASGASLSRGYSVVLQLAGKATEAMGRGGGVTGVPTDDTIHMKGQWSFGSGSRCYGCSH